MEETEKDRDHSLCVGALFKTKKYILLMTITIICPTKDTVHNLRN